MKDDDYKTDENARNAMNNLFNDYRFMANRPPKDFREIKKYAENVPEFAAFVKSVYNLIDTLQLTPGEIRQAVNYACYEHGMHRCEPTFLERYIRERDK